MSQPAQLLEYVRHQGALEVVTEPADAPPAIKGVRILGLESANGRSYLREGVSKALSLYEGKQVNADHPARAGEAVSLARRLGWLENVKQDPDGGLRGDLRLLRAHPLTASILEAARCRPQLMGLSHNASGKTRREGGREIVESIEAVHSVDLVADPATVSGLNEGIKMKLAVRLLVEALKTKRPGYARGLREQVEAGVMSPDTAMEEPAEAPGASEDSDHAAALKQGFRGAIMAVLDDDGMDLKSKVVKIKEILTTEEKMLGGGKGKGGKGEDEKATENGMGGKGKGDEPPPKDDEKATEESRRLKLENTGLRMLMEAGVKITPIITRALAGCKNETEVKELVEAAKGQGQTASSGVKSAAPWAPPATPVLEQKVPDKGSDWGKSLVE